MSQAAQEIAVVTQIERSVAMTGRIVDALTEADYHRGTGCTDWSVRDVLNHTVGGMHICRPIERPRACLAVATRQEARCHQALCEELLTAMHEMGGIDGLRVPGVFAAELPASADAQPDVRLLAYLGRRTHPVPAQRHDVDCS